MTDRSGVLLGMLLLSIMTGCVTSQRQSRLPDRHERAVSATRDSLLVQPASYQEVDPPTVEPAPLEPLPSPTAEATLAELQEIALANNPSLREAQAHVEAAEGRWVQVGLRPNPELGYSGQQLASSGEAEQHGLSFSQEYVRGEKLCLNRAIAEQEILRAQQQWAAQEQRVLTDVQLGYYDVLIAQERQKIADLIFDISQDAVETAGRLYAAMDIGQVDVTRARGALLQAQLARKNAERKYVAAWSSLAAVLGAPDRAPQPLQGDVLGIADRLNEEELLEILLTSSPEIAIATANVQREQWALERAYAEPIPNMRVEAIVQSDNGTDSANANLAVSFPLPWNDDNRGGIREAAANLAAADQAVERLALQLQQRLSKVYYQYSSTHQQVEEYSRANGILDVAKETLDLVQRNYLLGELSYTELLEAQTSFSQTNLAYVEALGELWAATVELEGFLLKDSLQVDLRGPQ